MPISKPYTQKTATEVRNYLKGIKRLPSEATLDESHPFNDSNGISEDEKVSSPKARPGEWRYYLNDKFHDNWKMIVLGIVTTIIATIILWLVIDVNRNLGRFEAKLDHSSVDILNIQSNIKEDKKVWGEFEKIITELKTKYDMLEKLYFQKDLK